MSKFTFKLMLAVIGLPLIFSPGCATKNSKDLNEVVQPVGGVQEIDFKVNGSVGMREIVLLPKTSGRISGILRHPEVNGILGAFSDIPYSVGSASQGKNGVAVWQESGNSGLDLSLVEIEVTRFSAN